MYHRTSPYHTTMSSSYLRLPGAAGKPTETKVFGPVFHDLWPTDGFHRQNRGFLCMPKSMKQISKMEGCIVVMMFPIVFNPSESQVIYIVNSQQQLATSRYHQYFFGAQEDLANDWRRFLTSQRCAATHAFRDDRGQHPTDQVETWLLRKSLVEPLTNLCIFPEDLLIICIYFLYALIRYWKCFIFAAFMKHDVHHPPRKRKRCLPWWA